MFSSLAQRNIDAGCWVLVLQGAVNGGQNAIARKKANGPVERQLPALHQVQRREREWSFENGLHRRTRVRMKIAIESSAWQRTGHRHLALSFGCNRSNLLLQRSLSK